MIRGVKFVGIPVKNQDAALKFWTEKVGLKIATDQEMGPGQRWIELSIPGAETETARCSHRWATKIASGRFQSIGFWCDDVVARQKALESRG